MATVARPVVLPRQESDADIGAIIQAIMAARKSSQEKTRKKAVSKSLATSLGEGQQTMLDEIKPIVDAQSAAARAAEAGATPQEAQTIAAIVGKTNAPARAQASERTLAAAGLNLPSGFHDADADTRARLVVEQFAIRAGDRTTEQNAREARALIDSLGIIDPEVKRRIENAELAGTSPETVSKFATNRRARLQRGATRKLQEEQIEATDSRAVRKAKALRAKERRTQEASQSDAEKLLRGSNLFTGAEIEAQKGVGLVAAKALVTDRRAKVKQIGSVAKFDQEVNAVITQHKLEDTPEARARAVNVVTGRTDAEQYFKAEYGKQLKSGEFVLAEDEQGKLKHRLSMGESETALLSGRTDRRTLFQEIVIKVNRFVEQAQMIDSATWATLPTQAELSAAKTTVSKHPRTAALIEILSTRLGMSRVSATNYLERMYTEGLADRRIGAAKGGR